MSRTDSAPVTAAQIDAVAAELDRELRRLHLTRADRRAVMTEIRSDLETAAADGVTPSALIGPDIKVFAREAAESRGHRARQPEYTRVMIGGSLAAVAAVVAAYLLIVEVLMPVFVAWVDLDGHYPNAGPVVVYGAVAATALFLTLAVLHRVLAGRPAARETVKRAAVLLPLCVAGGIAAAVAVGPGSNSAVGVIVVVLLTVLPVVLALALARWWAVRAASAGRGGTRDDDAGDLPAEG